MQKFVVLLFITIIALSTLIMLRPARSEITKPAVPEFTLKFTDNSYTIPTTTITTTDPFTGKQEVTTQAGYYIQNASIQITIKNQDVRSSYLYFDVRMKGHFSENWDVIAHREATPHSEYTVLTYALEGNNASGNFGGFLKISPSGGIADFQVQAQGWDNIQQDDIFGTWVMVLSDSSDWSNIQTISIPDGAISISTSPNPSSSPISTATPSQNPTTPQQSDVLFGLDWMQIAIMLLGIAVVVLALAVVLSRRSTKRVQALSVASFAQ